MSSNDPKGLATESELQEIMQEIEQMEAETGPAPEAAEMNEFRGSSDDASLEDTVGELKEDPAAAPGKSILDASAENEDGVHETADPTMNVAPVSTGGSPVRAVSSGHGAGAGSGSHSGSQGNGAPGSLTMTLSGNMTLRLRYEFEGQDVTVGFDEGCFRVELADGTEFKVPVRKATALKRVV
jgi:hypothetical protein